MRKSRKDQVTGQLEHRKDSEREKLITASYEEEIEYGRREHRRWGFAICTFDRRGCMVSISLVLAGIFGCLLPVLLALIR